MIRRVLFLAVPLLLTAHMAWGGLPAISVGASEKPPAIRVVGLGPTGDPDIRGRVVFTIRDAAMHTIPNAAVTLDFGGCPHIRICRASTGTVTCVGPNGQGTVTGVTDVNGQVGIIVVGSVDQATYASNGDFPEPDRQTPSPGEQFYFGCVTVKVTAPGFPPTTFPSMIASAVDHELVAPGVGSGDVSLVIADLDSGNYRERSDYDTNIASGGAGRLSSADLSVMLSFFSSSVSSCTPTSGGPCP